MHTVAQLAHLGMCNFFQGHFSRHLWSRPEKGGSKPVGWDDPTFKSRGHLSSMVGLVREFLQNHQGKLGLGIYI